MSPSNPLRPVLDESELGPARKEQLSRIRRSIARHMRRSLDTAAHCTTVIEVDMSAVEEARKTTKLTPLVHVAHAAIRTLVTDFPQLNATLIDDELTTYEPVHLGIAVSLGDNGLIVPVLHHADQADIDELGVRIRDAASRARTGALKAADVYGGTFTITNPGVFGSVLNTPIINYPEVAILDTEAIVRRPVVDIDPDGDERIVIRPMANLCLSWDHRAIDGATAASFLADLRNRLQAVRAS